MDQHGVAGHIPAGGVPVTSQHDYQTGTTWELKIANCYPAVTMDVNPRQCSEVSWVLRVSILYHHISINV